MLKMLHTLELALELDTWQWFDVQLNIFVARAKSCLKRLLYA